MNFVGHAVVASWVDDEPAWLLGSMLPDFAGMSRVRLLSPGSENPMAAAGIAHHHRTDAIFHANRHFADIEADGIQSLERRGLPRGPARAIAHVGTELLIDGLLLETEPARDAYLSGLGVPSAELRLRCREGHEGKIEALLERLRGHGLPDAYRTPGGVAMRLRQALRRRPRLRWEPSHDDTVAAWLTETRRGLEATMPHLMAELRARLGSVDTNDPGDAILCASDIEPATEPGSNVRSVERV